MSARCEKADKGPGKLQYFFGGLRIAQLSHPPPPQEHIDGVAIP